MEEGNHVDRSFFDRYCGCRMFERGGCHDAGKSERCLAWLTDVILKDYVLCGEWRCD
jgi:hypothetical protein